MKEKLIFNENNQVIGVKEGFELTNQEWDIVDKDFILSESFILENIDRLFMADIAMYQNVSDEILEEYCINDWEFTWSSLLESKYPYENFIIKHLDDIQNDIGLGGLADNLYTKKKFSEEFMTKIFEHFKEDPDYEFLKEILFQNHKLSDSFIAKFASESDWFIIAKKQSLTEEFIKDQNIENSLIWNLFLIHQKLSKEFISENRSKFDFSMLNKKNIKKLKRKYDTDFSKEVLLNHD